MWANTFKRSYFSIFLSVFLLGWCTYSLRLVSITSLVEGLSLKAYPPLMLVQGFSLFFALKIFKALSGNSQVLFKYLTVISGGLIAYFGKNHDWIVLSKELWWIKPCAFFLLSSANLVAFDIAIKLIMTSETSVLKNPNITGQLVLTQEVGVIFGALFSYLYVTEHIEFFHYARYVPFGVALFLLGFSFVKKGQTHSTGSTKADVKIEHKKQNLWKLPFFKYFVGLVAIILTVKCMQDFAMLYGISKMKEQSPYVLEKIYSVLFLIQTSLIILILSPSLFNRTKSYAYSKAVDGYFISQGAALIIIGAFTGPLFLIGSGVFRRVYKRASLSKAMTVIDSNIVKSARLDIKNVTEKYGQSISYLCLAIFSSLIIYDLVPASTIWFTIALISLAGLRWRHKLTKELNLYNMETVKKFKESPLSNYNAVQATYALASKTSSSFNRELIDVLKERPKSILSRSIIFSLGEMRAEETIPIIIDFYERSNREDDQQVALEALLKFDSYIVDLFFQKAMAKILTSHVDKGENRLELFRIISKRHSHTTLMTVLNLKQKYENDHETLQNIVEVMGIVAEQTKDRWLFRELEKYLSSEYPKRLRVNALKGIYSDITRRKTFRKYFREFMNSTDITENRAMAYLSGVIGLKKHLHYIEDLSKKFEHKSSTTLIALIRLNQFQYTSHFVEFVLNSERQAAITAINQLYQVEEDSKRYKVYLEVLANFPDRVNDFLDLLKMSNRDFNRDLDVIIAEAKKAGIELNVDLYGFLDNQVYTRRAS